MGGVGARREEKGASCGPPGPSWHRETVLPGFRRSWEEWGDSAGDPQEAPRSWIAIRLVTAAASTALPGALPGPVPRPAASASHAVAVVI